MVGRPHFDRLNSCLIHIAYGLYFHKFGKSFEGECNVLMDFLTFDDKKIETIKLLVRKRLEVEPERPQIEGANPEVFKYEFFKPDEFGLVTLRITFYGGTVVYVAFRETHIKQPFHLTMELINAGIKTHVKFEDGTTFDFN